MRSHGARWSEHPEFVDFLHISKVGVAEEGTRLLLGPRVGRGVIEMKQAVAHVQSTAMCIEGGPVGQRSFGVGAEKQEHASS